MSRGRGGRSAHESEESTPAPSSAPQPPPATPEDEEMPLARVRETAIAVKACSWLSIIFITVLNILEMHQSDILYLFKVENGVSCSQRVDMMG